MKKNNYITPIIVKDGLTVELKLSFVAAICLQWWLDTVLFKSTEDT